MSNQNFSPTARAIFLVVALIVIASLGYFAGQRSHRSAEPSTSPVVESQDNGSSTSAPASNASNQNANIRIVSPKSGATIISPVTITGKARGSWFFEAVFPIRVLDGNGQIIGTGQAHAQTDWMTSDFVDFTATISFTAPVTKTGSIKLSKDNPSGLASNDDSISIDITF